MGTKSSNRSKAYANWLRVLRITGDAVLFDLNQSPFCVQTFILMTNYAMCRSCIFEAKDCGPISCKLLKFNLCIKRGRTSHVPDQAIQHKRKKTRRLCISLTL